MHMHLKQGHENDSVREKASKESHSKSQRGTVDRNSLPSTKAYLDSQSIKSKSVGKGVMITCPVHKNGQEKTPSMSVNLQTGCFYCFACGVKGSDIIDLHRLLKGCDFLTAINQMGVRIYA